jgi:carbon storage regulator
VLIVVRKVGQQLVLGKGIVVTVTAIRGGQVRLGVKAPSAVPVWREEIAPDGGAAARPARAP